MNRRILAIALQNAMLMAGGRAQPRTPLTYTLNLFPPPALKPSQFIPTDNIVANVERSAYTYTIKARP